LSVCRSRARQIACYTCCYTTLQLLHVVRSIPQRFPPGARLGHLAGVQQQLKHLEQRGRWVMEFLREFAGGLAGWPNRLQAREQLLREALLIGCNPLAAQIVQALTPALDDLLRAGLVAQRHAHRQLLTIHRRQQHRHLEALDGEAGVGAL
jgi:hypothetical protein